MSRLTTASALLFLLGAGLILAVDDDIIPSEQCRGLWIVPVSFGDDPERTLDFILDTGASRSHVDPDSVARVFDRHTKTGKKVHLRDGRAGPLQLKQLPARVHDLDHIGFTLGRPIDGILGFDTFKKLLLTLDYPRGEVRVGRGELGRPDGHEIFADLGKRRPFIGIELDGQQLPLLIDSGSNGGLDLFSKDPFDWEIPPRPIRAAARYSGIEVQTAGRMRGDLGFGPLRLERPIVQVVDDIRLAGFAILERFEWTFDQRKDRIRMRPDSDEPILLQPDRGIGVGFRARVNGFEVLRVFDGSPAADAGLGEGDLVVAIDGHPLPDETCRQFFADPDQRTTILTVRRDGADRDLEVAIIDLVP
jgi:hypothetical protein